MLAIDYGRNRMCDGIGRRDVLRVGALGFGGLMLPDLLRLQAQAATTPSSNGTAKRRPKSVIMIALAGGPSHVDLYDMKPHSPVEYRSEFRPIATDLPGFEISELLPRQACIADKFAVIRSMVFRTRPPRDHDIHECFSGYHSDDKRPPLGAVFSRLRGDTSGALPPYVGMGGYIDGCSKVRPPEAPEFAGASHAPFLTSGREFVDMKLEIPAARLGDRKQLLRSLDGLRRNMETRSELTGLDAFTRRAFDMIASPAVREAFDATLEPASVRESYGPDVPGMFVEWKPSKLLLARRLVEAGVPVVTLCFGNWDHHGVLSGANPRAGIFERLKVEAAPIWDRAFSALITDLDQRGLLDDVAVVAWGEMGRTPRINRQAGRDHWQESGCALVAGGGFKTGQTIGATDRLGARPDTKPITPQNVLSMLYTHLGIDPATTLIDGSGRPIHILDDRDPVSELL